MTKNEFMAKLTGELKKINAAEAADIAEEYEQHFAFKLADGYSEEEIAAKLGDPAEIAAQFERDDTPKEKKANRPLVVAGLIFADIFAGMLYILLWAWELVMGAAAIALSGYSVCLLFNIKILNIIPMMPYYCAVILAVALIALAVLFAVGCIYYAAFLRQLARAYARFHHNALAAASGKATLPALFISPQFSPKAKRSLRGVALISLIIFAADFVLAYILCSLSAGALEFWHVWGWF